MQKSGRKVALDALVALQVDHFDDGLRSVGLCDEDAR